MQPLAGQPIPAHTIFSSPIRHAGNILLFEIPLRSPQGDLSPGRSTRSISACVLFLAMRWQHPPPQIGERGRPDAVFSPPIVFWTLLAVSSTSLPDPPSL